MGLRQLAYAIAVPPTEKGRACINKLHFVWQSWFGSPATEITIYKYNKYNNLYIYIFSKLLFQEKNNFNNKI